MSLKRLEANQSQKAIINALIEKPMTFSELLEKTGISRAVLNKHLKKLEKKGIIEKIYKEGKILNVLKPKNFDVFAWLLDQLAAFDVPEEIIKKGREFFTESTINLILLAPIQIMFFSEDLLKKTKYYDKIKDIPEKEPPPDYILKRRFGMDDETLHFFLNHLDIFYLSFIILFLKALSEFVSHITKQKSKAIDELSQLITWWEKDVLKYIPSRLLIEDISLAIILDNFDSIVKVINYSKERKNPPEDLHLLQTIISIMMGLEEGPFYLES